MHDAGAAAIEGSREWLKSISGSHDQNRVVIIRDADLLDDAVLDAIISITRRQGQGRLIVTMASGESGVESQHRLRSIVPSSIVLPPLRERPEDIEPIARQHLAEVGRVSVYQQFYAALRRRPWTGNVAGLKATLNSALGAAQHGPLGVEHLPAALARPALANSGTIQHAEESAIRQALAQSDGNRSAAAELLGISRATLYRRLRTYRLD